MEEKTGKKVDDEPTASTTASTLDSEHSEKVTRLSEEDRNMIGKERFKKFIQMIESGESPKEVVSAMNKVDDEYYKEELKWYLKKNYKIDLDTIMK